MADQAPTTSNNTFSLFESLPYELRREAWLLSTPPPRIVSLVSKTTSLDHPSPCAPFCLEHRPPYREQIPNLLHVCAESRAVGLEAYAPFNSAQHKSRFVDLRADTLLYMPCHHKTLGAVDEGKYGVYTDPFDYFWSETTDLDDRVLSRLAIVPDDVAKITSLMLCICQVREAVRSSKFEKLVRMIQAYKSLKEIIFVQLGGDRYVAGLGSAELGVKDEGWLVLAGWHKDERVGDHTARAHMWRLTQWVYEFKMLLGSAIRQEDGASPPNIRCAVLTDGKISWEQEFGANIRNKWEASLIGGRNGNNHFGNPYGW